MIIAFNIILFSVKPISLKDILLSQKQQQEKHQEQIQNLSIKAEIIENNSTNSNKVLASSLRLSETLSDFEEIDVSIEKREK